MKSVHKKSVHKKSVHKKSVHKKSVHKKSVHKKSVHKKSVHKKSVHKKSVHKKSVRKTSVRKTSVHKKSSSPRVDYRLRFSFGDDDIDPRAITDLMLRRKAVEAGDAIRLADRVLSPERKRELYTRIDQIENKYFINDLADVQDEHIYIGNDAFGVVADSLHITPERLSSLIPAISELAPEEITVTRIKLLLRAYFTRELDQYLNNL